MPKLWTETVDTHRREVRDAILDTAGRLATEHGVRAVTMSQIAEEVGIGRATLYRYFPDVEAILVAWHEREVDIHLDQLAQARDRADTPIEQLDAVLTRYALITHQSGQHHDAELSGLLHRESNVHNAEQQLHHLVRDLIDEGVGRGDLRSDVNPAELATFCLHALSAARTLPSKAAVRRLVTVILAGLRPSDREGGA